MEVLDVKLTQFSRGAGCGCKISPKQLAQIIHQDSRSNYPSLLVGNDTSDDAAVYALNDGTALISTTDFFMPIVDDPFDFGRIAAANSISDVYAMGGKPLLAIAILGWPLDKLPVELARKVMDGGRSICEKASIPLAGGHSVDATEPFFGLAVTGRLHVDHLKKNSTAKADDVLFLTKAIGTGILSTAQKRGVISKEHAAIVSDVMCALNDVGELLGKISGVNAMTDITGFGLAGHLMEMMDSSNASCELTYSSIKRIQGVEIYLQQRTVPDATFRNWNSYSEKISFGKGVNVAEAFSLLPDPQTNGGLLISVSEHCVQEVVRILTDSGLQDHTIPIGKVIQKKEKSVYVI